MLATVVSGEHDVHFLIATSNRMQKGYGKFSCASNCCCFNRKMHKVPFVGDLDDSQPREEMYAYSFMPKPENC